MSVVVCNLVAWLLPGSTARDVVWVSWRTSRCVLWKELVRSNLKLVFFIECLVLGNKFDLLL